MIASTLASAKPQQRVALLEFAANRKNEMAKIEDDPEIKKTLASGKIEYVYSIEDEQSKSLIAYAVKGKKQLKLQRKTPFHFAESNRFPFQKSWPLFHGNGHRAFGRHRL